MDLSRGREITEFWRSAMSLGVIYGLNRESIEARVRPILALVRKIKSTPHNRRKIDDFRSLLDAAESLMSMLKVIKAERDSRTLRLLQNKARAVNKTITSAWKHAENPKALLYLLSKLEQRCFDLLKMDVAPGTVADVISVTPFQVEGINAAILARTIDQDEVRYWFPLIQHMLRLAMKGFEHESPALMAVARKVQTVFSFEFNIHDLVIYGTYTKHTNTIKMNVPKRLDFRKPAYEKIRYLFLTWVHELAHALYFASPIQAHRSWKMVIGRDRSNFKIPLADIIKILRTICSLQNKRSTGAAPRGVNKIGYFLERAFGITDPATVVIVEAILGGFIPLPLPRGRAQTLFLADELEDIAQAWERYQPDSRKWPEMALPAHPITPYGTTQPEEAFAEAIMVAFTKGYKALDPIIRLWLTRYFPNWTSAPRWNTQP